MLTDGQTDRQTKYCNPPCACTPRVNYRTNTFRGNTNSILDVRSPLDHNTMISRHTEVRYNIYLFFKDLHTIEPILDKRVSWICAKVTISEFIWTVTFHFRQLNANLLILCCQEYSLDLKKGADDLFLLPCWSFVA